MCEPITAISAASTILSGKSMYDANKARKQDRKEREKMAKMAEDEKDSQTALLKSEHQEKANAKRTEYARSRSRLRTGATRGRMSTVLDKRDSLG